MKFFLYFLLCAGFMLLTYRMRWLSLAGGITASLFGYCLLVWGGAAWIAPVLFFFATSSVLSKIRKATSTDAARGEDVRDAWQVLSNGGVAWLLLLISLIEPEGDVYYAGFVGAMAAATADTWGTELGRLFKGVARSILTGRVVATGVSGGMSWQGTLGGAVGAGLIGASVIFLMPAAGLHFAGCMAIAGVVGSLADSLLGATLQARYQNTDTGEITEYPDEQTILYQGLPWMSNNTVNFCCTLVGSLTGMVCW